MIWCFVLVLGVIECRSLIIIYSVDVIASRFFAPVVPDASGRLRRIVSPTFRPESPWTATRVTSELSKTINELRAAIAASIKLSGREESLGVKNCLGDPDAYVLIQLPRQNLFL